MSNFLDRVLMAYRPLYLRGLLQDGQYRLFAAAERSRPVPACRVVPAQTVATMALTGLSAVAAIAAAGYRHPTIHH
jgi:hypothetical protein